MFWRLNRRCDAASHSSFACSPFDWDALRFFRLRYHQHFVIQYLTLMQRKHLQNMSWMIEKHGTGSNTLSFSRNLYFFTFAAFDSIYTCLHFTFSQLGLNKIIRNNHSINTQTHIACYKEKKKKKTCHFPIRNHFISLSWCNWLKENDKATKTTTNISDSIAFLKRPF